MTGALVWVQIHWIGLLPWVGSGMLLAVTSTLLVLAVRHGTRHQRPAVTAPAGVEGGPVRPRRHRGHHRRPRRVVRHPGHRGTVYRSRAGAR